MAPESNFFHSHQGSAIHWNLVKTKHRLTLDIVWQAEHARYRGEDDGPYWKFVASNRYEIYSRSRMDIQTERIWLLGAKENDRSGSMVFSSDEKRDIAFENFVIALHEWEAWVTQGMTPQVHHSPAQDFPQAGLS